MEGSKNPYPLPSASNLGVDRLVGVFRNTTNSYKFLWFLALVEELADWEFTRRNLCRDVRAILTRMLGLAWHPIRQFRLSFGSQDQIHAILQRLAEQYDIPAVLPRNESDARIQRAITEDGGIVADLARYVPYRFLSPWFARELRGHKDARRNELIREGSARSFRGIDAPSIYRFHGHDELEIEIHPAWAGYISRHSRILSGFTRWELLQYLERRNPGVPNIAGKLEPPARRDLDDARRLWRAVLEQEDGIHCIYTGRRIEAADFSLDHFVPWSFVAHDLLWNLVPVSREVNSRKGDLLPDLERHLPGFARVQHRALHRWRSRRKAVEQYVDAFRRPGDRIAAWTEAELQQALGGILVPLVETARNQGFKPWAARG